MRLAAIVLAGFAVRLVYLIHVTSLPGFRWHDPDLYMNGALQLARGAEGWHWSFDAVSLTIGNRLHVLPPLYTIFLSIFASFRGFPFTAQLAQVGLAVAAIALVYELGRRLQSARAGLIAAAAYALWAPNILNVWSTSQETLYIPLVLLAFVLLARAMSGTGAAGAFLGAGVAFGCAALARSMPLFFVPIAALLQVLTSIDRRGASKQAAMLLVGLAAPTVPYIIALSVHVGQFTPVDSHGSIHVAAGIDDEREDRPLSIAETAGALTNAIAADPVTYLHASAERARSLLHVNGGRVLQIYAAPDTKAGAWVWKAAMHVLIDGFLVLALILAPFGVVLSRERRIAGILVVWILVNVTIASVGGFGGARLRAPFEPVLLVFAAVAIAGNWRWPSRASIAAATIASVGLAAATLPQVPRSLAAWPSYGVAWTKPLDRESGRMRARAGFNVLAREGMVYFTLRRGRSHKDADTARVRVRLAGRDIDRFELRPHASRDCAYPWAQRDLVFVEVESENVAGGRPVALAIATR
jgi:4-amino-4-deoxy-L-arabinose transferase-like glycosyltransferase